MMYSTLDILLMGDPDEKMSQWEETLAREEQPKFRYPLKIKDQEIDSLEIKICDPEVDPPKEKNKVSPTKTVDTKKNKKNKNGLF